MAYNSAEEVLGALVHAYYDERDVAATLACVTDDVEWVGTEDNDSATGKEALQALLEADVAAYPHPFGVELDEPYIQPIGSDGVMVTVTGKQLAVPEEVAGFSIRGTACIVKTDAGWLIQNVHTSVPNSQIEKYSLEKELDMTRKKEQLLLAGIPGGIAIYRLKKNGTISTDYASDGLAKMCGYSSGREFIEHIKSNAMVHVVQDDIPMIAAAIQENMKSQKPVSVIYRLRTRDGREILQRLDANTMDGDLGEDDVAICYAVHTIVSDESKNTIDSLKELQELINHVPCGIGIYDINDGVLNLTYLNDAYYEGLGVSREERKKYYGNNVLDAIYPEDHKAVIDIVDRLINGSNHESIVIRIRNHTDNWIWYTLKVSVIKRKEKQVKLYVAYFDCNKMVLVQREREEKYDEMLRLRKLSTKDAFSVGTFNLSKNIIMETDSEDKVIEERLKSCSVDDMLHSIWQEINFESSFPKNCAEMLGRYKKGEIRFVVRYYLKTRKCWIESNFDLITNPYNGDVEATGIMRNITESVRSELVVSKLLETDYDSIATIDIETGIVTPFTISSSEIGMKKVLDIQNHTNDMSSGLEDFYRAYCAPEDVERVIHDNTMSVILDALKEQVFYECSYSVNFGNGVEHKRAIYTYLDINKEYLVCAVQNFTAAYQKEEKQKAELNAALRSANAANKAKTDFLSRVSHDMRTPLNGILGLTTLLKDTITDNAALHDLSELEMSGRYLLELINDTLDMSRIESGNLELHPIVCDGRAMFNNSINLCKASIQSKKINFIVDADNIPFTLLYVDVSRFQQAVMNVFGNAVKFTPDGGTITLSMHNKSVINGVITDELIIQDTGVGMSPEFLPHIFEAFSQENTTATGPTQGTGLGMAITKQILNLMGGDIRFESEQGKGTTAIFILKFNEATDEQIAKWEKNQFVVERGAELAGRRILLCEDHPLNVQIATRLLNVKNVEVDHAANGQIGVDMFKNSTPGYYDAILMDIRMPVMDGIEATKTIRNLPRQDAKTIPILAMTANAFTEDMEQSRKAGMNAHISKPIQPELLYRVLSKHMNVSHEIKKETIMVVDDVDVNRAVIRASLEDDYDILEAENGKRALEMLENIRGIDAVITDIQMPEMDGITLIRQIRNNKKYRHVVIIANTQFGDPEQEEKLLALGANDFVYKPTTPKIVEIRIRNALKRI